MAKFFARSKAIAERVSYAVESTAQRKGIKKAGNLKGHLTRHLIYPERGIIGNREVVVNTDKWNTEPPDMNILDGLCKRHYLPHHPGPRDIM